MYSHMADDDDEPFWSFCLFELTCGGLLLFTVGYSIYAIIIAAAA